MDWQAQKMNIITGAVVVVIAGMMAYKFHVFGGGESAPPHKTTTASFATPPAPAAQTPNAPAAQAPGPVAANAQPSAAIATPPASISMGGASSQAPSITGGGVTPLPATVATLPVQSNLAKDLVLLHHEVTQVQGEVQALSVAMGKMQSHNLIAERALQQRIQQVRASAHNPFAGQSIATRTEIAGYHLQSIGETEAWLTNPDGETVIARAGDHLPGLTVEAVTPNGVKTTAGWLGF